MSKCKFFCLSLATAASLGTLYFVLQAHSPAPCELLTTERLTAFLTNLRAQQIIKFAILILFAVNIISLWLVVRPPKNKQRNLICIFFFLAIFTSLSIVFGLPSSADGRVIINRDSRRIVDLQQVQTALDQFFDNHGSYPLVTASHPVERWQKLNEFLSPSFIPTLPNDPCNSVDHDYQYDYKVNAILTVYVLKAILEDPMNPVLAKDLDGSFFDVWCGKNGKELEYCIRGKSY